MLDIVLSTRANASVSIRTMIRSACLLPLREQSRSLWRWLSSRGRLSLGVGAIALSTLLGSCSNSSEPQTRNITLEQQWELNPGDKISGSLVSGSLGDISIVLGKGTQIRAPFDGLVEPTELEGCDFYSTPEIPAYLFRLCGLRQVAYGDVKENRVLGKGNHISFATLRKQPDGTWIIVEPAKGVLERAIKK